MLGFDSHLGITKEEKIEDVLTKDLEIENYCLRF